ncbi:MAG TPA: cysteine desulfurase family protein [Candidatus Paceibacterota bacterium]|nr:cysteine desulfurase family protein [Candidatus Paceibacterota bacterium]
MRTIYLDHAASTPLRTEVLQAMLPYLEGAYGNPSSLHHKGREAERALRHARAKVAALLAVAPDEVVFTGSGTEANNLALLGTAEARSSRGRHVLVSPIEHPSVLSPAEALARAGFDVEYLPVDAYGRIDAGDAYGRVRPDTILVSVMYANNEIGTVEPIAELGELLAALPETARPLLHTDACQALGQLPISPVDLHVDLMSLNSAKAYGPKGVGMLYVRTGVRLAPRQLGGSHERGLRAGTENLAGIVGFSSALELAIPRAHETARRLSSLRNEFIGMVRRLVPSATVNGHPTERLPNNVHLSVPYIEGESLLLLLDTYGICAATGSACSAHDLAPSHVLRAIGQSDELIHGSLRLSFGDETTRDDLAYVAEALAASVRRLTSVSPLPLHV